MTAVADLKRVHRATCAAGDYAAVAEVIDAIPPRDVLDRVGVEPGMDVLDVAGRDPATPGSTHALQRYRVS